MAIVIIHGPDGGPRNPVDPVRAELDERAQSAGHELLHVRCDSERQLVDRLARIDRGCVDIILLDPGRCTGVGGELSSTLEHLQVPYIEVHGDSHDRLESVLPAAGPRLAVVNGYAAQGYTLAMSMALEQLGCAESENDVHVGT